MTNRAITLCRCLLGAAFLIGMHAVADSPDAARLDEFYPRSTLRIATPDARLHTFNIWIADTEPRRQQGLMFVSNLNENEGMLFLYPRSQEISMWMKNTLIPLDMLFVNTEGRVEHVVENTTPHSLESITSRVPVVGVIELKGGTAARLKIRPGAQVIHPAFATQ